MKEKTTFYTVRDVAETLDVSISTVHTYIKDGSLDAYRILGRGPWRIRPEEFKRVTRGAK